MGERNARTTERFQPLELVELTKKPIVSINVNDIDEHDEHDHDHDPLDDEWTEPGFPSGSQSAAASTRARTPTVHDPMTTGLLAEVARRSSTLELDADTLAAALKMSRDTPKDD
jgi:hypothetical protein